MASGGPERIASSTGAGSGTPPDPLSPGDGTDAATDIIGRAARLLFVNGQTTEAIHDAADRLGHALGAPSELLLRWGELSVRRSAHRGWEAAAAPDAVDIRRVLATEDVIDGLVTASFGLAEARNRLEAIAALPPVSLTRFALMAAAGASALGVIFGASEVATIMLVALSAGLGAVLRRTIAHVSPNPFAPPFFAALLAGVVAAVALLVHAPVSARLVAVCPCMVLVPGPHLLNGGIDLARSRIPLGTARIAFASLILLAISAGLLAGLRLATADLPPAGTIHSVPFAVDIVMAGVAVAAYGSFFDMPWRLLTAPVAIGVMAHAAHWAALHAGFEAPGATFLACLVAGSATAPLAKWSRLPFGATGFAATVSLMPGLYLFQAASAALALIGQGPHVEPSTLAALVGNTTTAVIVAWSITAGIILPKMVFDIALHRRRGVSLDAAGAGASRSRHA